MPLFSENYVYEIVEFRLKWGTTLSIARAGLFMHQCTFFFARAASFFLRFAKKLRDSFV